jgi:hypothetical protein
MNKSARLQMHRDLARRQAVKPDPWELIEFRGWTMSRYTAAALSVLEEELGYELTIVNGPYNDDVSASANTHNEDAVVDLAPYQARRKCMASRKHGWASWIRPYNWNGRGGGKHLHQVLKGARDVNELAEWQRDVAYPNRWSGLVGNATDNFPTTPSSRRSTTTPGGTTGCWRSRSTGSTPASRACASGSPRSSPSASCSRLG